MNTIGSFDCSCRVGYSIVLKEIVMVCCIILYSITQNVFIYNMCKWCHINDVLYNYFQRWTFYDFYILWKIFVTCIYILYVHVC